MALFAVVLSDLNVTSEAEIAKEHCLSSWGHHWKWKGVSRNVNNWKLPWLYFFCWTSTFLVRWGDLVFSMRPFWHVVIGALWLYRSTVAQMSLFKIDTFIKSEEQPRTKTILYLGHVETKLQLCLPGFQQHLKGEGHEICPIVALIFTSILPDSWLYCVCVFFSRRTLCPFVVSSSEGSVS